MENSNTFQVVLTDIDCSYLLQEMKAIKAFNYQQYLALNKIITHLAEKYTIPEDDVSFTKLREFGSINFKQYKKINNALFKLNNIISTSALEQKEERNVEDNGITG